MTRIKMDFELENRLEAVREVYLVQRRRRAMFKMALWTIVAVLIWVVPVEMAPNQTLLHWLGLIGSVAVLVMAVRRWLLPLAESVSYEQIARYIDEHHPELQDRLTALVGLEPAPQTTSKLLIKRFLEESQTTLARHPFSPWQEFQKAHFKAWPIWVLFLVAGGVLVWHYRGNVGFLQSLRWAANPGSFTISPGDAKVRPGEDLMVLVRFKEEQHPPATIQWREAGSDWQEAVMQAGEDPSVRYHQFENVHNPFDYRVHAGKDVTTAYHVMVWEPPSVDSIDLVYTYPGYLKLPNREVAFSGHITAVEGTKVTLEANVNKEIRSAAMILEKGEPIPLERKSPQVWEASIVLTQNNRYHLELLDKARETNPVQTVYDIVVHPDKAPVVKISFPRNDMEVSLLDELSFDFTVEDDFGLADYGLRYQVVGRDPVKVSLKQPETAGLKAEGHHQLMLEEMKLQPGDLLTWTVYAEDAKPGRPEFEVMAEPYFLEIRPFKKYFSEAVSQAGLQGGGGAQDDLVQKQKEVLIATWNLRKRAAGMDGEAYELDRERIQQVQTDILDKVNESGGVEGGIPGEDTLPLVLGEAVTYLGEAAWPNPEATLGKAADAEQRAFQMLLKMQPDRSQVSQSRQSDGQGGSQRDNAMDELEMNRNRNFYEEEKLTQNQEEAAAETLKQIKDLARRQKMLNDEIAKLISEREQEKDEEALRRKLERLREELQKSIEQLDEAQRDIRQSQLDAQSAQKAQDQLDQAREDIQQTMEQLSEETLQQARSSGRQASSQLERASRDLGEQTRTSTEARLADLQHDLNDMTQLQEEIQERMGEREENERGGKKLQGTSPGDQIQQDLMDMKKALKDRFLETMERASKLAENTAGDQDLLSRKLGDWLRETSKEGLLESVSETEEMVQYGMWEALEEKEKEIAEKLAGVKEGMDKVATMSVGDETQAVEKSLQALQNLRQSWESGAGEDPAEDMRRFVTGDYRDWLDTMRDVDDLLPGDHIGRPPLNSLRREVERIRKEYRRRDLEPEYELFLENVSEPLAQLIETLSLDVARLREERAFVWIDDGTVPDRYRKKVADYFEALSHAERNRPQ